MSIGLVVNSTVFNYPEQGDTNWGDSATSWAQAVTVGMLQKAGGSFVLTSEVDFGTMHGLMSLYYKARSPNPASAGTLRLGVSDVVAWRNNSNTADLTLGVNASNQLTFNGTSLFLTISDTTTIDLTLAANVLSAVVVDGSLTNLQINASAAIAQSKLALSITNAQLSGSAGITNANLASMATLTIKGNNTGGSAAPIDLSTTQVNAILPSFTGDSGSGGVKGLVPAPAPGDGAAKKVLEATGNWVSAGAGTVISVGLTMPSEFSVASSPVTSTGTLAVTKANQSAGTYYGGPLSGSAAAPTFKAFQPPTVQKFLSGSGTYTTPVGVLYIKARMVGGGGGGGGSGTGLSVSNKGGDGASTTFGSSLLVANGGAGGAYSGIAVTGGVGGTASLGTGPVGLAIQGGSGNAAPLTSQAPWAVGGSGGSSPFGGAGSASYAVGVSGIANTGSGGGGGGGGTGISVDGAYGGGAGGFIDVFIYSPSASYGYSVGAAGTAGAAGTSGTAGGAGGSGVIIIEEYYT